MRQVWPGAIFVDGLDHPGLSAVHLSGFTVKNADREGIFVLNATDVSLSGNTVTNNDRTLTAAGCPNVPSYEPGEMMDCGEGIHLQAVDHSIVTNNIVMSNAGGGVLLSDDTGGTHHNLVSFNTVTDNTGACGITLASHIPPSTVIWIRRVSKYRLRKPFAAQRHQRVRRRGHRTLRGCGRG